MAIPATVMGAMQFGAPILGGIMGSKGGPEQVQNTVTDTQTNPYMPGMASDYMGGLQGAYNNAMQNVNFGPTGYQNAMFDSLMSSAYGG